MSEWIYANYGSQAAFATKIGRSASYVSSVLKDGRIKEPIHRFITTLCGLPADAFIVKAMQASSAKKEGYWLDLDIDGDIVTVTLMYDDEVVNHAYAVCRGKTELDLLQAISYAAHMIYKFGEQRQ